MTQTILPSAGTQAADNAQAVVDEICALCDLYHHEYGETYEPQVRDLLNDLGISGILSPADQREIATQTALERPLSVRYRWECNAGETPNPTEPDEYEILMSTGGPSCRLEGTFGVMGQACVPYVLYQHWGVPEQRLHVTAEEQQALVWFAGLVAG